MDSGFRREGGSDTSTHATDAEAEEEEAWNEDLRDHEQEPRASPPVPLEKVHPFEVDAVNVAGRSVAT